MKDYDTQYSPTYPVSGEWWVNVKLADGTDIMGGYSKVLTYNTAANTPDSIWVTDVTSSDGSAPGNFWTYKCKAACHMADNTFSLPQGTSVISGYNIGIKITNGKVIKNGAVSPSGAKTDSIYYEIAFQDDTPSYGTKYICSGYRRTGFQADDH
ncbi:MAG: lipid-binding protein [Bacteroidota bacterium]|nr:lipid-binding protein [Bacteroidota bacterium]